MNAVNEDSGALFGRLVGETNSLSLPLDQLQRIRTLMRANQVNNIRVGHRIFEAQRTGLLIVGSEGEGRLFVLDHPSDASTEIRTCRNCGCSDLRPCMTPDGACTWHAADNICSKCQAEGPQSVLFPVDRP